jgi:anti-anti-sigma regulatory factor
MSYSASSESLNYHATTSSPLKKLLNPFQAAQKATILLEGDTLKIGGKLNFKIASQLKKHTKNMLSADYPDWKIDLSEVVECDAVGLGALVHALELSEMNNKRLLLLNCPTFLRHLIEKAQLHQLFHLTQPGQYNPNLQS